MFPPEGWSLMHDNKVVGIPTARYVISLLAQDRWEIYIKTRLKQGRKLPWDSVDWSLLGSATRVKFPGQWPVLKASALRVILDWSPTLTNMVNKGYTKIPSFDDGLGETCCRTIKKVVPKNLNKL